jgi:hypothetical protein
VTDFQYRCTKCDAESAIEGETACHVCGGPIAKYSVGTGRAVIKKKKLMANMSKTGMVGEAREAEKVEKAAPHLAPSRPEPAVPKPAPVAPGMDPDSGFPSKAHGGMFRFCEGSMNPWPGDCGYLYSASRLLLGGATCTMTFKCPACGWGRAAKLIERTLEALDGGSFVGLDEEMEKALEEYHEFRGTVDS